MSQQNDSLSTTTTGVSMTRLFGDYSIRTKLIVAFLILSVFAVGAVAFFTNRTISAALTADVGKNLNNLTHSHALSIGNLLARELDTLQRLSISRGLRDRLLLANTSYGTDPAEIQTKLEEMNQEWIATDDTDFLIQNRMTNAAATELLAFRELFPDHVAIIISDQHGGVLATTNRTSDYYQADEAWWQEAYNDGQGATYISLPVFDESSTTFGLIIALPFYDDDGSVIGILRSTFRLTTLEELLVSVQVGQTGRAELYLPGGLELEPGKNELESAEFDLNLLAQPQAVNDGYVEAPYDEVLSLVSQAPVSAATNETVIADLGWTVVVRQERQEALAPVEAQGRNIILLAAVIAGVAVIAAIGMAQLLTRPIVRLTGMAEQVAGGDLASRVEVNTGDEIGALAISFNSMTDRLRNTIDTLEERVTQRTRQLETVVGVSQRLSSILDLGNLMQEVVTLTKENFNYYHVHIYMMDDADENLIMAEGYGEAGAEMKRQRHYIPLISPRSLVARAARERKIITVENVRGDPSWLPNPLLPDTHSEMAVPVTLDAEVVGVLDVQSEKIGGLTTEDEGILQILANQLATTIRNVNLFSETEEALSEAEKLQRLYTGQGWEKFAAVKSKTIYEVRRPTLPPLEEIAVPEAEAALLQRKTVNRLSNGDTNGAESASDKVESTLATPLKLGNEIIGVLGIRDEDPERQWTDDEIALIEAVSEQMSLALENARLVEETQRNAWRDRVVSESTARVWSTPDIEEVMKVAVAQLGDKLRASEVVIRLGTKDELE